MPVQLWSFKAGFAQVCLLLCVSFILTFIHDYLHSLPQHYFNLYGISYQGLLYFLFFLSLTAIAVHKKRLHNLDKLVVLFLSVVPVIWLGTLCLIALFKYQEVVDPYWSSWIVFIVYSIWYLLVALRLIRRFFYLSLTPALAYVLLYAVINFSPLFVLPSEPLWRKVISPDIGAAMHKYPDVESVYYDQTRLLNAKTASLFQGKPEQIDTYFVGFAGDASEDVFMNEALAAEQIVKNRFYSYGRTSVLINNRKTLASRPLANQHNLEKILESVASKMDTAEDVLFLFITSHGTEDHQISTEFEPFNLNSLDPVSLRQMLDRAGIDWRIIVISACYSGGFIKHLENSKTLLITAARADRNSFGCGHDGQYTYFGEAFFESGLKQGMTLVEAFEQAKLLIKAREKKEGFTHSLPQKKMGTEIAAKLIDLQSELSERKKLNWASAAGE